MICVPQIYKAHLALPVAAQWIIDKNYLLVVRAGIAALNDYYVPTSSVTFSPLDSHLYRPMMLVNLLVELFKGQWAILNLHIQFPAISILVDSFNVRL